MSAGVRNVREPVAVDKGTKPRSIQYTPVAVSSAVGKVKNLLTGLAPTDGEIAAVSADQSALALQVARWIATPEYESKMRAFFATAFQQSEITWQELVPQFGKIAVPPFHQDSPFVDNLAQSFARTAMELVREGKPFTATMTTTRFMMTPAMMAVYALLDSAQVSDEEAGRSVSGTPPIDIIRHEVRLESDRPIPIERALDPASPDYMTFYAPALAENPEPGWGFAASPDYMMFYAPALTADPQRGCASGILPPPVLTIDLAAFLLNGFTPAIQSAVGSLCPPPGIPAPNGYLEPEDFTTWHMVTVRQPRAGEETTPFYEMPEFRAGGDLVLNIPRVGFFTTLSFFGQWSTNKSNLARVTANQTLIVALGQPVDLTNKTEPPSLAALDSRHAEPGTECYDCHRTLDPARQFFRQAYTLAFSKQKDPSLVALPGQFGFHSVSASGVGIGDLGTLLATHPLFPKAWVQKLCTWANSAPCSEDDPEFVRLVGIFVSSGYSWNTLVTALFSSPITTNLKETASADAHGEVFPVARQSHLCALLANRLGITDVCGLAARSQTPRGLEAVHTIAATWPSEAYARGSATPVLANSPSVFARAGMENICNVLADYLIDNTATPRFRSARPETALQEFTATLMGLGSDRRPAALKILREHFRDAQRSGVTGSDALKSTFIVACLSPFVVGVGL